MTISLKRILIFLGILYGAIFFVQHIIGQSIEGINRQGSLHQADQPEHAISVAVDSKKVRSEKKADMTPEERYQQAKKNLDHEELKRKYGIIITPRRHGLSTVDEWQQHFEKNMMQSDYFKTPEAQTILSTLQVSEEKFKENMSEVQKNIDQMKSKLAEEPFNKKYKQRLQNMYRLQALGNVLKKRIVVQESASGTETIHSMTNL